MLRTRTALLMTCLAAPLGAGAAKAASTIFVALPPCRIADTRVAGGPIAGNTDRIAVLIESEGQHGTISSSARFKEEIHDMGEVSARILDLRPVTFRYKKEVQQGEGPIEYGLIAEEVANVFPELVIYDKDGQPETVKYQALAPLLLNELQKERRARQSERAALQARIDDQQAELEEQRAQLDDLQAEEDEDRRESKEERLQVASLIARLAAIESRAGRGEIAQAAARVSAPPRP